MISENQHIQNIINVNYNILISVGTANGVLSEDTTIGEWTHLLHLHIDR